MKTLVLTLFLICVSAQVFGQDVPPAPSDKAVVYFARPSALGFAINFTYFDSATFIARFNGGKFVRYECEPGHHLFWARSENRDFVSADLEAGRIYFIEAIPKMGALKASVRLNPIDPAKDTKALGKIIKLLGKKDSEPVGEAQENVDEIVERGLERYKEDKAAGSFSILSRSMYYQKE